MSNRHRHFNTVITLFWLLFGIVFLMWLINLGKGVFDGERLISEIQTSDSTRRVYEEELKKIRAEDSLRKLETSDTLSRKNSGDSSNLKDEIVRKKWKWVSSTGRPYFIEFNLRRSDYAAAVERRLMTDETSVELWAYMSENDRAGLADMINAYKKLIIREQLDYFEAMDAVVTSIQTIPYTWVLAGDRKCGQANPEDENASYPEKLCKPSSNPQGCCDGVSPWAVYSPIEFAMQETGDCDTKSLMAYTILDELNKLMPPNGYQFDVAMLMGDVEAGRHAMLGINIPNPPYRVQFAYDARRVKYFAWEATTTGCLPGQRVWETFRNWDAYKLN